MYPAISLKDARTLAANALSDVAKGGDPAEAKRRERERQAETVRAVVEEYIEKWQKPRNKTAAEVEQVLKRVLVEPFGSRDVREISRRDLKRELGDCSRNTLAKVKHFFNWCAQQDIIDVSPAAPMRSNAPIVARDRVLSADELRAFLWAIKQMGEPWASIYELLAITAQRRSEVAEAPRFEFDMDGATWTIAPERAKNGRAHIVHLAPRAVEIVRRQGGNDPEGYLFPAAENGGGRGKFAVSGFAKAKRRLDALMFQRLKDTAGERGENPKKVKLEPWRIHDLRRTGATGMAALGIPIHVVERVLNHVAGATTGGLVAVYQRHEYLTERRTALETWADYLRGLEP
jgi:integrase